MTGFLGWRIVGVLAVTETISWGVLFYAYSVIQVPMAAELGLDPAELGAAFSVAILATGLVGVLVGRCLDLVGGRVVMTAGSIASAAAVVAWSRVESATGLYLAMVALGAARSAVLYEPAFAVVVRWFHHHRARALLAITTLGGLASTVALPATEALVAALGWRDALLALSALLLATTALPHWLLLRRDPADVGQHPDGAAAPPPPARLEHAAFGGLGRAVRWAAREASLRWFALAFGCHAAGVAVLVVGIVPFLREHGHAGGVAAAVAGSLGALSVTGRWVLTGLARRLPLASVAAALSAVQALGLAALLVAPASTAAVVAFVLLFGIGFGIASVARPSLLVAAYGPSRFATIAGLVALVATALTAVAPVAAGLLRQVSGASGAGLIVSAALCVVGALALRRAARLAPHPVSDPGRAARAGSPAGSPGR